MKYIRTENYVKIIYVQKKDLYFLYKAELSLPLKVWREIFPDDCFVINEDCRDNFIKSSSPIIVDFFENAKYVLDYDMYGNEPLDILKSSYDEMVELYNKKVTNYKSLCERSKTSKLGKMKKKDIKTSIYAISELEELYSNEYNNYVKLNKKSMKQKVLHMFGR